MLPDLPDEDRIRKIGPEPQLLSFGEYLGGDWIEEDSGYVYAVVWNHESLRVEATGEALHVRYFAREDLTEADYRHDDRRARAEESAWDAINSLVRQAARGSVFIHAASVQDEVLRRVRQFMQAVWKGNPNEADPAEIDAELLHQGAEGVRAYEAAVTRLRGLGGDPENPRNTAAGWYVPVEPLPGSRIGVSHR